MCTIQIECKGKWKLGLVVQAWSLHYYIVKSSMRIGMSWLLAIQDICALCACLSLCLMHVHVCIGIYVCTLWCICTCMHVMHMKARSHHWVTPLIVFCLTFWHRVFDWIKLIGSTRPSVRWAPETSLDQPFQSLDYSTCCDPNFLWILGIQTSVIMLTVQVLYQLSHLSNLPVYIHNLLLKSISIADSNNLW